MIRDQVIAGASADHIGTASAVDRVIAGPGRDAVHPTRTGHRQRRGQCTRIHAFKIARRDTVPDGLIGSGCDGEIDRRGIAGDRQHQHVTAGTAVDGGFGTTIGDRVIARAGIDDVEATITVDRVVARATGQRVDASRADD